MTAKASFPRGDEQPDLGVEDRLVDRAVELVALPRGALPAAEYARTVVLI